MQSKLKPGSCNKAQARGRNPTTLSIMAANTRCKQCSCSTTRRTSMRSDSEPCVHGNRLVQYCTTLPTLQQCAVRYHQCAVLDNNVRSPAGRRHQALCTAQDANCPPPAIHPGSDSAETVRKYSMGDWKPRWQMISRREDSAYGHPYLHRCSRLCTAQNAKMHCSGDSAGRFNQCSVVELQPA